MDYPQPPVAPAEGGFAYLQQEHGGLSDGFQEVGGFQLASGAPDGHAYAGQGLAASSYATDAAAFQAAGAAPDYAYTGQDQGFAAGNYATGALAYSQGVPADTMGMPPAHAAPAPAGTVGLAPQRPLVIIPLARKGDRAGIERQLQAGASVHETDIEGNTPLHVAVEAPRNEIATVQCLLENGADANALNFIGATPLHYVCLRKSNCRGVANILLENAAQINRQTVAGKSALHFACENQLPELVEVLCLFGADTNLADVDGNTPVHLTVLKEGGRDTVKKDMLEHLVTYRAGCAWANSQGLTPVHASCQNGYIHCLRYLLRVPEAAGVPAPDATTVTSRGQTGVHLACLRGHAPVAQLMLQLYPGMLDSVDVEGNTPLHCCAQVGNLDCALVLLKLDANTSLRDVYKKTAFEVAKIRGTDLNNTHNPELVQVLKDSKRGGSCRQS